MIGTGVTPVYAELLEKQADAAILVKIFGDEFTFWHSNYQMKISHILFADGDGNSIHRYHEDGTLGLLFNSMNMRIDDQCYVFPDEERSFCTNDDYSLKYFINGESVSNIRNYIIQDNDRILITFGGETDKEISEWYLSELNSIKIKSGNAMITTNDFPLIDILSLTSRIPDGGNLITYSGKTINVNRDVYFSIDSPTGNHVDSFHVSPDASGDFSTKILILGQQWDEDGTYSISVGHSWESPMNNGYYWDDAGNVIGMKPNPVELLEEVVIIKGIIVSSAPGSSYDATKENPFEQTTPEQTTPEQTTPEQTTPEQTTPEQTTPEQTTPEVVEMKIQLKKYSDNKYNFSFEYPVEFDSHFKGVDSTPMIWKNDPHPELPWFKVWKTVKTIPEGLFATTYEFKVYSDNEMSEYSQSELLDLLENSSINVFTDMCSPENCTVTKTDSNISTNNNGAKILDIIVQTVTDYEKGVTQYITNSMRITMLNVNNDVLMIQHTTSSNDNFTHLFYEPHFTHMVKSLETQYIPKDSLKNTSTIFTAYGETVVTPEGGGGCLIATATYGSELAPQVQQLRELRDNQLLQTESGTAFMGMFNDIYYSFSPTIADMEREHPLFKETVKIAITPMISSLSLMENANSESEVLSIGISVIVLNLGMYLGVPAIVIVGIRKRI